ncbi:FG-GAP-like repeat-containing protein [Streptomyces sp. NPDC050504]|uniref:FG-GAP-like repeat-containing protein n=1 Tax=Streptomyces sp. NPDC050504 TaxID=3365618 RepID=UPI0037B5D848
MTLLPYRSTGQRTTRAGIGALMVAAVVGGGLLSTASAVAAPVAPASAAAVADAGQRAIENTLLASGTGKGRGITYDYSGTGSLYTIEDQKKIWHIDSATGKRSEVAHDKRITGATALAADCMGHLYVHGNKNVWKIDLESGSTTSISKPGWEVRDMATDKAGNVYLLSGSLWGGKGELIMIPPNGEKIAIAEFKKSPHFVSYNPGNAKLYVGEQGNFSDWNKQIVEIDPKDPAGRRVVEGGLGGIEALAIDRAENLFYVGKRKGEKNFQLFHKKIGSAEPAKPIAGPVEDPRAFVVDGNGNGYLLQSTNNSWTGNKWKLNKLTGVPAWSSRPLPVGDVKESELADFTGDGKADLVAKDARSEALFRWNGDGKGTFGRGEKLFDQWNYTQTSAGDFDGDGKADLVAAAANGQLYLWRGKGDGTFGERESLTKGWGKFEETTAGDFDHDGVIDLVAREKATGELKWWRGSRKPGNPFEKPLTLTGWKGFGQTTAADVNGDGFADLVAVDPQNRLKVWLNDQNTAPGHNPFMKPVIVNSTWDRYGNLAAGDLDGDGKDDLFATDNTAEIAKTWKSTGKPGPDLYTDIKKFDLEIPDSTVL